MTSRDRKKTGVRVGFCFTIARILWASHGRPLPLCLKVLHWTNGKEVISTARHFVCY